MSRFIVFPIESTLKVVAVKEGPVETLMACAWCFPRCLSSYLSGRYRQAERSSFTVQPRSRQGECWEKSEASAAVGQMSTGGGDDKNPDVVKSECLVVFWIKRDLTKPWLFWVPPAEDSITHLLFSPLSNPHTLFRKHICTSCKPMIRERKCVRAGREEKRAWNRSLSLMMPTQRQWGAALISVTCPCASHQLHYGSISHASCANWIAREVVTRTGARATSVPLLPHKWEERFPERHEPRKHKPLWDRQKSANKSPSCYIIIRFATDYLHAAATASAAAV